MDDRVDIKPFQKILKLAVGVAAFDQGLYFPDDILNIYTLTVRCIVVPCDGYGIGNGINGQQRKYERQNHYQTDNSCSHFFLLAPFAKIIVSTYDKYYTELLHHLQRYSYKKFKNSEIASYIRK